MKHKLFKTFVTVGTTIALLVVSDNIKEEIRKKEDDDKLDNNIEMPVETINLAKLYIFDNNFKMSTIVGNVPNINNRYFLMENTDKTNCMRFESVFDKNVIGYYDYQIHRSDEDNYIEQAASLIFNDFRGQYLGTIFLDIKGIYTLKEFLEDAGLDYLIKDDYTLEELECIKELIDKRENVTKKYLIDDIIVVDFRKNANENIEDSFLLLTKDKANIQDEAFAKIIYNYYGLDFDSYEAYEVWQHDFRGIITTKEEDQTLSLFEGNATYNNFQTNLSWKNKGYTLREFLEFLQLDEYIKDAYSYEELADLYNIIKGIMEENNYTRILEK